MHVCVVYASEAINSYSHEMNLQSNTSGTTPVCLAVMVGVFHKRKHSKDYVPAARQSTLVIKVSRYMYNE